MKIVMTILLMVMHFVTNAQQDNFVYSSVIKGNYRDVFVDNLGNVFLLNENGQLKKTAPNGDSIAVFNNTRRYGKLHQVDVTNPLKILLFFKDFSTVVVLDRMLNQRSVIDLRNHSLFQVSAVAQSYDNNIWVYDEQESKLRRINEEGQMLDQTTDFRILFDTVPSPSVIIDQDKQLYLYDSTLGVYIFDYYGALKRKLAFLRWTDVAVINQAIFGRKDNVLYKYEPGTLDLQEYQLPSSFAHAKKFVVGRGKIYLLTDSGVLIYEHK